MKCGSKHISFWQCLLRHFNQRLLAFVSFLRSASWFSIQSRTTRCSLLFFSCLLTLLVLSGNKPVFGQDPTNTPTPTPSPTATFRPLFRTPTPRVEDFTCPGYQPNGWGVATPSTYWLMNCMQCVTPVSDYDWGDNPFGTPTPGSIVLTPTPETPTITPIPYNIGEVSHDDNLVNLVAGVTYEGSNTKEANNATKWTFTFDKRPDQTGLTTKYYSEYNGLIDFKGAGPIYAGQTSAKIIGYCYEETCKITHNNIITTLGYSSSYIFYTTESWNPQYDTQISIPLIEFELEITEHSTSSSGFIFRMQNAGSSWGGSSYISTFDHLMLFDNQPLGLEPTPTPPPGSYCSNVEETNQGAEFGDDNYFKMPVPYIGDDSCFFVPNITIPLSWLSAVWPEAQDLFLPGFQFCSVPVYFGTLTMFGLNIDLDLIAILIGFTYLIRLTTRS